MGASESYSVTVLLDVNDAQNIDDRAEARTYIVSDRRSGRAIIIDAVLENVERDCKVIRDLGPLHSFSPSKRTFMRTTLRVHLS